VLIVCEHGIRSMAACQALVDAGWANIVNIEGGMAAWIEAGLPVERKC
jgi:rhodanese-related sulfurtransferase